MSEPAGPDPDEVLESADRPTVDEMQHGEVGGYGGSAAAGPPAGAADPEGAEPPAEPDRPQAP